MVKEENKNEIKNENKNEIKNENEHKEPRPKTEYKFILKGISLLSIEKKYGFKTEFKKNVSAIDDLETEPKKINSIIFLDEAKRLHTCAVSFIDFEGGSGYKCFHDCCLIPKNIKPIGCPIRYIPSTNTKTYFF
jgi:hypothetical protein